MPAATLEKLQVLVTGVDAAIARDVVRMVVAEGGVIVAADRDADKLARLNRDVGLYRTRVETANVDLANATEVRLWEASLRAFGRLPHVMICCCGSPAHASRASKQPRVGPADVALSEQKTRNCPAAFAERVLQPTLFLHAQPLRRSLFDQTLAVLRHPTLRGVLERGPGHGVFNPQAVIPYVRIASQVYSLRRHFDGAPSDQRSIRLVPDRDTALRADAA